MEPDDDVEIEAPEFCGEPGFYEDEDPVISDVEDDGTGDALYFPSPIRETQHWHLDDLVSIAAGGKRGMEQGFPCHYCETQTETEPLYCPHPDTLKETSGGNPRTLPDLEHQFCSYKCMKGWAMYEIGGPMGPVLCTLVDRRAGGVVEPAPPYTELLVMGLGGLTIRDDFVRPGDDEVLLNANPEHADADGRRVAGKSSRVQKP